MGALFPHFEQMNSISDLLVWVKGTNGKIINMNNHIMMTKDLMKKWDGVYDTIDHALSIKTKVPNKV